MWQPTCILHSMCLVGELVSAPHLCAKGRDGPALIVEVLSHDAWALGCAVGKDRALPAVQLRQRGHQQPCVQEAGATGHCRRLPPAGHSPGCGCRQAPLLRTIPLRPLAALHRITLGRLLLRCRPPYQQCSPGLRADTPCETTEG